MSRGGRKTTTWQPGWKLGKTSVIRIPEVIKDDLFEIARHLDDGGTCLLQGNEEAQASDAKLDALRAIAQQWREELSQRDVTSPRWKKVEQLLVEVESLL